MAITASMVKELREKTGAGMMDCKKALTQTTGDMDAAVKFLREKGLAAAAKKAGRVAAEGLVGIVSGDDAAALIEINCETDFVAKNDDFQNLVKDLADHVLKQNPADVDDMKSQGFKGSTVGEAVTAAVATIGENIGVRRFVRHAEGNLFGTYSHSGGKIGVVVSMTADDASKIDDSAKQLAKDLAMHVASEAPIAVRREDVDAAVLDNERDIFKAQALEAGKPENIVEKIVEGRVKKFLAESVFLEQQFVKDPDISVQKLVEKIGKELGTGLKVNGYTRFKVGEGIEKKKDDLAAEVAKMTA